MNMIMNANNFKSVKNFVKAVLFYLGLFSVIFGICAEGAFVTKFLMVLAGGAALVYVAYSTEAEDMYKIMGMNAFNKFFCIKDDSE